MSSIDPWGVNTVTDWVRVAMCGVWWFLYQSAILVVRGLLRDRFGATVSGGVDFQARDAVGRVGSGGRLAARVLDM